MAMNAVEPPWLLAPELHIYERVAFAALPGHQLARKRELVKERSTPTDEVMAAEGSGRDEAGELSGAMRSALSVEESKRDRAETLLEETLMAVSEKVETALQQVE